MGVWVAPASADTGGDPAQGRLHKTIGAAIDTTQSAVMAHRARIMRKTQATALADLIRMANRLQIEDEITLHRHGPVQG